MTQITKKIFFLLFSLPSSHMSPPAPLLHSLSSSLLWEILTPYQHTHNCTLVAFSLCCRWTLNLLEPDLQDRYREWQLSQKARKIWLAKIVRVAFFIPIWPPSHQEIHADKHAMLFYTVCSGDLPLVQWVVKKWPPTREEVHLHNYVLIHRAAYHGYFDVFQWLVEKWPPTDEEVHWHHYKVFQRATHSKNLALVKYLIRKWRPTREEVYFNSYWLLFCAVHSGNLDMVKLFVEENGWPPRLSDFNSSIWYPPLIDSKNNPQINQYLSQLKSQLEREAQEINP